MTRRMRRCVAGIIVGALGPVLLTEAQTTERPAAPGAITGVVQALGGKPVAGATVHVVARPSSVRVGMLKPFYAAVLTDDQGRYTAPGIPEGTFAVCAAPAKGPLLPNCAWDAEPLTTVAAGSTAKMEPITLKEGVDLYVRVNDPQKTRANMEGKVPGASLFAGVRTASGMVVPIPMTAADSGGSDHHMLIPPDADLKVMVVSNAFDLTDETGAAIDNKAGHSVPVSASKSAAQRKIVVNVTGVRRDK